MINLKTLIYCFEDTYRRDADQDKIDLPPVSEAERSAIVAALKMADGVLDILDAIDKANEKEKS